MKILVIQLARLGDIYLSWPAVRALRRKYPQATIDVLTRPRFTEAWINMKEVDHIVQLPTQDILAPLINVKMDLEESFLRMNQFLEFYREKSYDSIFNFSFSPLSSHLAHSLTAKNTQVTGYTRHEDGFLSIPDDMSAYFYAQVGPGRPNRFHLAEIFGTLIGMDLISEDWDFVKQPFSDRESSIVIHVGASEKHKSLSSAKWINILNAIIAGLSSKNTKIYLIGAEDEMKISEEILVGVVNSKQQIQNLVGKTQLVQVMEIISQAKLLIGCDSAPIHIASLTQTPTLNLSVGNVNFWETGPRSKGSWVICANNEEEFSSYQIAFLVKNILSFERLDEIEMERIEFLFQNEEGNHFRVIEGTPSYRQVRIGSMNDTQFDWQMVQAIYQGKDFIYNNDSIFQKGINKLNDINQIILDQLNKISEGVSVDKLSGILDRGEEIIQSIGQLAPSLSILIRWYQTEKIRIPPLEQKLILQKTIEIHNLLQKVIDLYKSKELTFEESVTYE